jgi:hypothetical protein
MSSMHVNPDTRLLDETYKAAQESEQISIQVYDQLRQQREQLNRASLALHETDDSMARSNVLLRNMIRRYICARLKTSLHGRKF